MAAFREWEAEPEKSKTINPFGFDKSIEIIIHQMKNKQRDFDGLLRKAEVLKNEIAALEIAKKDIIHAKNEAMNK